MTDQNVCPYCGGEVRTTCEYQIKRGNWRATVACDAGHSINFRMQMSGNASIPTVSARAIHAFTHPAHLMEGKVMVGVEDARLVVECCEKWNSDDALHLDAAERLSAALDAAKGE